VEPVPSTAAPSPATARREPGISARAVVISIVVVVLTNWWMYHSELVTGRYVTQGVPPVPSLLALLLGLASRKLFARAAPRLVLSRSELMTIFIATSIAVPITAAYGVRAFLPHLTASFYRAAPENGFAEFNQYIPSWYAPHEPETVRQVFEGIEEGEPIPWRPWVFPLSLWTLFILACFVGALSLASLLHREWADGERLIYPLTFIPLHLTRQNADREASLLANPLAWIGIGIAAIFNLWNILGAFNPSVPSPQFYVDVSWLFTEQPWTWLRPVLVYHRPDIVGLAYLIPSEILLSGWLLFFVFRVVRLIGFAAGQVNPAYPFPQEQATGGYLGLALLLLWSGRRGLVRGWHDLLHQRDGDNDPRDPVRPRWAIVGIVLSGIGFLTWCGASGMSVPIAAMYLVVLALFVVVYVRFRAEAGVPIEFLYPYGYARKLLLYGLGARFIARSGGPQTLTILTCLAWLARHHLVPGATAYAADSFRYCDAVGMSSRRIVRVLLLLFVVGLAVSYVTHFRAYYTYGQNVLEGRTFEADYRAQVALEEFTGLDTQLRELPGPDAALSRATLAGFAVVTCLSLARRTFMRFPLHPLGYILSICYGVDNPWWFALLLAWAAKTLVLKLGGLQLYRRFIPLFLGLYLGHLFVGGLVWPTLSIFIDYTISMRYHIYFG